MQTRYKIIIIVCLSFILISYVFPQVFLIFHLDKYETNEQCDTLNGTWDWYSDKCVNMEYKHHDIEKLCTDLGAKLSCDTRCSDKWEWNYWTPIYPSGCLLSCLVACDFTKEPDVWMSSEGRIHNTTGNPNECWYKDDDGNIVPCKMDFEHGYPAGYVLTCESDIFGNTDPCKLIDENGNIIDTKIGIGD